MNIVIYGADISGKKAYEVCEQIGFDVIAFIDADPNKNGKLIDNISVYPIGPDSEELIKNNVVMMGTNSVEAYKYVSKLTNHVMNIETVYRLFTTYGDKKWPNVSLSDEHIQNCKLISNRVELLKYLPKNAVVAEIGVYRGEYSKIILDICKPKKLYLIDLWESEENGFSGLENYQLVQDKFRNEIENGQVELIKKDSIQALESFCNQSLDWVYVDTVHDYITPHRELEIAKDKVNENGFICGHDYSRFNMNRRVELGVWNAVNEFVVANSYEFAYMTFENNGLQSYAIKKVK